jgi:hypothetical protein
MMDEETRARAAGLTNPLGYFSGAQQGYGNILGQPQQQSMAGPIIGGALSALAAFCWITEAVYGKSDFRVPIIRQYLMKRGGFLVWLYRKIGERVAKYVHKSTLLRAAFRRVFDSVLCAAGGA